MAKIPEKLGSEYYRGFLTRQGRAFYDRINAQLLRGDYSGKTTFSISNPETSASDCFAAYKAIRDDRPEFFYLGNQSEFTRRGRIGTLEYPILYVSEIIDRIRQQVRKKFAVSFVELPIFPCLNEKRLFTSVSPKALHTQTTEM